MNRHIFHVLQTGKAGRFSVKNSARRKICTSNITKSSIRVVSELEILYVLCARCRVFFSFFGSTFFADSSNFRAAFPKCKKISTDGIVSRVRVALLIYGPSDGFFLAA